MAATVLSGITVLDLTRVMSGPYCTLMLADMGARVIKVEHPTAGDDTRAWGPPFIAGESLYFLSVNRNKESLTLDFKQPEGRRILETLIDRADVFVENFTPGVLQRLGLDYASLAVRCPRLVYASVSGYGHSGPLRDRAGYDAVIQAESGLMSVTGEAAGSPVRLGVPIADLAAGLFAVQGILAALLDRTSSGRGRHIDIAMSDAAAALLPHHGATALTTGESLPRMGNGHSSIVPYDTFQARDGLLMLAVGNDDQWRRFCAAADRPTLAADHRYATNAQRVGQRDALVPLVASMIVTRDREEWVSRLREAGVPCGIVRTVDEATHEPQLRARGMIAEVQHPTAGLLSLIGSPVTAADPARRLDRPPPLLGQHTDTILGGDLGLGPQELHALRVRNVV